jgi:putative tryptophan/tyrosine transport system substrate-binding protein
MLNSRHSRRTVLAGLARTAALLALANAVKGQAAKATTKRLAMIRQTEPAANLTAAFAPRFKVFFDVLAERGYVEGQNLDVVRFSGDEGSDKYASLVHEVIRVAPDVIFVAGGDVAQVFKPLVPTTPIVAISNDPMSRGLVFSLAHPGGNITGVSVDAGLEIWGKRLSILKEAVRKLSKPYFLAIKRGWESGEGAILRQAADQLGLPLWSVPISGDVNHDTYLDTFRAMKAAGGDGLIVSDAPVNTTNSRTIAALANQFRLPTVYPYREFVVDGGLLAYSIELAEAYRLAAGQIADIFAGTRPADLPFLQQTKFQLIANATAAQAIDLTLPPSLLLRADEVIG